MASLFSKLSSPPAEFDGRKEWGQLSHELDLIEFTKYSSGMNPESVVHLGGTALYYYLYSVYGEEARNQFRGTHDIDIITFFSGTANWLLDNSVRDNPEYFSDYELNQTHLPTKQKGTLRRRTGGTINVDIYESPTGEVIFNNRKFQGYHYQGSNFKSQLALYEAQVLNLSELGIGFVAVPSFEDLIILKLDLLDKRNSLSGLRPKDKLDIMSIVRMYQDTGWDIKQLFSNLRSDLPTVGRLQYLKDLFNDVKYYSYLKNIKYGYTPSSDMLQYCSDVIGVNEKPSGFFRR